MNENNTKYTLSRFRSDVFRVLDEYSRNSANTDIYSGGVGDIEKRFICAANNAIRLASLACDRRRKKASVVLKQPHVLMHVCDFSVSFSEERLIFLPEDSGAVSFFYSGEAKLIFRDGFGNTVLEKELLSDYGEIRSFRANVPLSAKDILFVCDAKSSVDVKGLKSYTAQSVGVCRDESYLPDGKNIYCAISPDCYEMIGAKKIVGDRAYICPYNIFTFSDGVLSCDEKYAGTYEIEYLVYPSELSENCDDTTPIELDPCAYSAAVYAAAAELCEREDGELYTRLTYKYREILANCYPSNNTGPRNSFYSGGIFKSRGIRRFFG